MEPWLILRCPGASVFIYAMPAGEKHKTWVVKSLSLILDVAKIQIEIDSLGKPRLPYGMGFANWSHSKGQCVLAYSKECEVGVDLEFHSKRDFGAISKRFFSQSEITDKAEVFYPCWAKKEAYYKCLGGSFYSILKNDSYPNAKIWNLQGPYKKKHELALAIQTAAIPANTQA